MSNSHQGTKWTSSGHGAPNKTTPFLPHDYPLTMSSEDRISSAGHRATQLPARDG